MEPGRELDLLIAEKVFKRDRFNAREGFAHGEPEYHWGYPVGHDRAPNYSTSISAAIQIVQQSRHLGYDFRLSIKSDESGREYASVQFEHAQLPQGARHSYHPMHAATHAICLAALDCVGVAV
jgi:hypothetical protein